MVSVITDAELDGAGVLIEKIYVSPPPLRLTDYDDTSRITEFDWVRSGISFA